MNPKTSANLADDAATGGRAESEHYIREVAAMGDAETVTAAADILSESGIKLVAKGHKIDSRLRDKLLGHSLREPLDRGLEVANGVNSEDLAKAAVECLEEQPWWQQLAARSGDPLAMRHGLARLKIPAATRFNLTLARQQRPALYRHSLRVALLCHYLAIRLEWLPAVTDKLLLAALCHDLGELHIDPAVLAPDHRITGEERRFVLSHPIIGNRILRDVVGIDAEVARTVLHHHERLDGSGYPFGLSGDAVSPLSRILMVADVAESILARFPDRRRLCTMLRLNLNKYDGKAVALLHDALIPTQASAQGAASLPDEAAERKLAAVAAVLTGWEHLRRDLDIPSQGKDREGVGFLFAQVRNLNSMLLQFGFNPDNIYGLAELAAEDPEIAGELAAVLDELLFQMTDMSQEIDCRGNDLTENLAPGTQTAFAEWRQSLQVAVSTA